MPDKEGKLTQEEMVRIYDPHSADDPMPTPEEARAWAAEMRRIAAERKKGKREEGSSR